MKINKFWYDDERFWKSAEPILFTKQRRSDAQSEVTKIIRLLNIGEKDRILDLCCGIGRHSLEFARRRYTVTAVDKTSLYLKKAVRQVKTEKLSVNFI